MRTLATFFGVIVLTFCLTCSAQAMTLGGSIHGSGWLPERESGGANPVLPWTKEEHDQAEFDAIYNASELLEIHIALQMWDFPNQVYSEYIILDDAMDYYPDAPAHYTYSIMSYLIVFESGQFAVIYP